MKKQEASDPKGDLEGHLAVKFTKSVANIEGFRSGMRSTPLSRGERH